MEQPPDNDEDVLTRIERMREAVREKGKQLGLQYGLMKAAKHVEARKKKAKDGLYLDPCSFTAHHDPMAMLSPISPCEILNPCLPQLATKFGTSGSKQLQSLVKYLSDTPGVSRVSDLDFLKVIQEWTSTAITRKEEEKDSISPSSSKGQGQLKFKWENLPKTQATSLSGLDDVNKDGELLFTSDAANSLIRLRADAIHQHVALIVLNTEGEILTWNTRMEQATGVNALSAVGNDITAFLPLEQDQEEIWSCLTLMDKDQSVELAPHNYTFTRSDGINMAHLTLQLIGGRSPGHILAVGSEAINKAETNYSKWVIEQVQEPLKSLKTTYPDQPDIASVLNIVKKSQSVDTSRWGRLNIRTALKKLVVNYQMDNSSSQDIEDNEVSIKLCIDPSVPEEVHTDFNRYPLCVAYLVTNAVRFSPKGGQVQIEVGHERCTPEAMGKIVVKVSDEGSGMPEDVLKALKDYNDEVAPGLVGIKMVLDEVGGSLRHIENKIVQRGRRGAAAGETMGVPVRGETVTKGSTAIVEIPRLTIPRTVRPPGASMTNSVSMTRSFLTKKSTRSTETTKAVQEARHELLQQGMTPLVRCLVVESNVIYRMSFCHHLWERSYALSLAGSIPEVMQQIDSIDIIVIDVEEEEMNIEELIQSLTTDYTHVQVILASRIFNAAQKQTIKDACWFGITLPVQSHELQGTLDEAELRVYKNMMQKKHIEDVRKAFNTGHSVPWERGRVLGAGNFGKVFEATNKLTGGKMAVKAIPLGRGMEEEALLQEVKLMATFEHTNIIHYFYSELTTDELLIFMEFAADGTLADMIPPGGMQESMVSGYMEGILRGLGYLHNKGITHRDIKVANVLINKGVCKLTDFGTATATKKGPTENSETVGTLAYMSPEVLEGAPPATACDIWALGCLLMELTTNKSPFAHAGESPWLVVKYISGLKIDDNVDVGKHAYGGRVMLFLRDCLCVDPARRPNCDELLQSPLIQGTELMMRKATVFSLARVSRKESMISPSFRGVKQSFRNAVRKKSSTMSPQQSQPRTSTGNIILSPTAVDQTIQDCSDGSDFSGWGDSPKDNPILPDSKFDHPGTGTGSSAGDQGACLTRVRSRTSTSSISIEEEEKMRRLANRAVTDTLRKSFVTKKPPIPVKKTSDVSSAGGGGIMYTSFSGL
eukprot:TRINITY_DN4445_c2_g1_i1.p1 TRINITY_DN4445_c2_g1~~TRINITY_DN4445_c2_g1_i1.p1  ORF type:complete len:1181 (+),score=196.53 TRINITY_DN4445_c2_g1_i1:60-3545(+)